MPMIAILLATYNSGKYIKEHMSDEFIEINKVKTFLFMNVSNEREADIDAYELAEASFFEFEKNGRKNSDFSKEYRDLVIGCLGCMKEHFGNNELCNFDETYKVLTHNPNASLDKDFAKLDSKYRRARNENIFYKRDVSELTLSN